MATQSLDEKIKNTLTQGIIDKEAKLAKQMKAKEANDPINVKIIKEAFNETIDFVKKCAIEANYTVENYRGHPSMRMFHPDYSGFQLFAYSKGNNVIERKKLLEPKLIFEPEDENKDATLLLYFAVPAKMVADYVGAPKAALTGINMKNEFKIKLTPHNHEMPLEKRRFKYSSIEYTAKITHVPLMGSVPVYFKKLD